MFLFKILDHPFIYNNVIITMSATNGSWCFKSAEYMYNKFLL